MAHMHWYTTLRNSINMVPLAAAERERILIGPDAVADALALECVSFAKRHGRPCRMALDGYLGAHWKPLVDAVAQRVTAAGMTVELQDWTEIYRPDTWQDRTIRRYTDTDESLGRVCRDLEVADLLDATRVRRVAARLCRLSQRASASAAAWIGFGVGVTIPELTSLFDRIYFYDLGRVTLTNLKFAGELRSPHRRDPETTFFWKRENYFYYPILDRHRRRVLPRVDGYVDANVSGRPKLLPRKVFQRLCDCLSTMPIKTQRFMQPGNWGGLHHSRHFELPELKNCAWDTTFYGPKTATRATAPCRSKSSGCTSGSAAQPTPRGASVTCCS